MNQIKFAYGAGSDCKAKEQDFANQKEKSGSLAEACGNEQAYISAILVNYERNQEALKDVPFLLFFDLALVPVRRVDNAQEGSEVEWIHDHFLYGETQNQEELAVYALKNAAKHGKAVLKPMSEVWGEPTDPILDKEETQYLLSNPLGSLGAVSVLYPGVLQDCAKKLGGGFYIVPSSIHEMLLIPKRFASSPEDLIYTVNMVNEVVIPPEEVLSDNIYWYDPDADAISMLVIERDEKEEERAAVRSILHMGEGWQDRLEQMKADKAS